MSDITKTVTDAVGGGVGLVGSLVMAALAFGEWARRERSAKAKTDADVSASKASAKSSDDFAKQIQAVSTRADALEAKVDKQQKELDRLRKKLAHTVATRVSAAVMLKSIHICDGCNSLYGDLLREIVVLLKSEVDEEEKDDGDNT